MTQNEAALRAEMQDLRETLALVIAGTLGGCPTAIPDAARARARQLHERCWNPPRPRRAARSKLAGDEDEHACCPTADTNHASVSAVDRWLTGLIGCRA